MKISARLMLWMEAISVAVILIVIALVLVRHGLHLDCGTVAIARHDRQRPAARAGAGALQLRRLRKRHHAGRRSAQSVEDNSARRDSKPPLSAALSSPCARIREVLGFRIAGQDLGTSQAPMHVLAAVGGVPLFGLLIDIGALVSLFAGTLACITAAARVLLLMAHNGLAHGSLRTTHVAQRNSQLRGRRYRNRRRAPVAVLAARGASGLDVYGWMGSLATYGFIVAYALVCIALPRYLRNHGAFIPRAQILSRSLASRCCSRSSAISILSPKALTASCPTFISYISLPECSGS